MVLVLTPTLLVISRGQRVTYWDPEDDSDDDDNDDMPSTSSSSEEEQQEDSHHASAPYSRNGTLKRSRMDPRASTRFRPKRLFAAELDRRHRRRQELESRWIPCDGAGARSSSSGSTSLAARTRNGMADLAATVGTNSKSSYHAGMRSSSSFSSSSSGLNSTQVGRKPTRLGRTSFPRQVTTSSSIIPSSSQSTVPAPVPTSAAAGHCTALNPTNVVAAPTAACTAAANPTAVASRPKPRTQGQMSLASFFPASKQAVRTSTTHPGVMTSVTSSGKRYSGTAHTQAPTTHQELRSAAIP